MAVDHRINRHSEQFKGIDKRSSNIQRTQEYATNIKNCSFKTSGSINKRKGFHINSPEQDPIYGSTSFGDRDNDTGSVTQQMILVNKNVNKLVEYDFTINFNHPVDVAAQSLLLNPESESFSYSIYNYNTDSYMFGPVDVGDGFGDSLSIEDLIIDINKVRVPVFKVDGGVNGDGGSAQSRYSGVALIQEAYKKHSTNKSYNIVQEWVELIHKAVMANVEADFSVIPVEYLTGWQGTNLDGTHNFTGNANQYYPISGGDYERFGYLVRGYECYPKLYETFLTKSEISRMLVKPDENIIPQSQEDNYNYAYLPVGYSNAVPNINNWQTFYRFIKVPVDTLTGEAILVDYSNNRLFNTNNVLLGDTANNQIHNLTFNEYHSLYATYNGPTTSKVAFMDIFNDIPITPTSTVSLKIPEIIKIPLLDEEKASYGGSVTAVTEQQEYINSTIPTLPSFNTSTSTVTSDGSKIENATFAEINNVLYISNGYDNMLKYDGNYVYKPGLPTFYGIVEFKDNLTNKKLPQAYAPKIPTGSGSEYIVTENIGSNKFAYSYIFRFAYEDAKGNIITGEPSTPRVVYSPYDSYRSDEYTYELNGYNVSLSAVEDANYRAKWLVAKFGSGTYVSDNGSEVTYKFTVSSEFIASLYVGRNVNLTNTWQNWTTTNSAGIVIGVSTPSGSGTYDVEIQFIASSLSSEFYSSSSWQKISSSYNITAGAGNPLEPFETNIVVGKPNHKLIINRGSIFSQLKSTSKIGYDVESEYPPISGKFIRRKGEDGESVSLGTFYGKKLRIEIFRTKMYNPGGNSLETAGQYYFIKSIPYDNDLNYNYANTGVNIEFIDNFADEIGLKETVVVDESPYSTINGIVHTLGSTSGNSLNPFLIFTDNIKRHDPPPKGKYLAVYKNVLVVSGQVDNVNNIQYSLGTNFATGEIGSEYFPSDDNGVVIQSNFGDKITAIAPLRDLLYIFHKNSIHVLGGNLAEPVGIAYAIDLLTKEGGVGCLSMSSLLEFKNSLAFVAEKGIYVIDSTNVVSELSENIRPYFTKTGLSKNRSVAFNWVDENCLVFSIPKEKVLNNALNTYENTILVYDYFKQAWLEWDNLDFSGGICEYKNKIYFSNRQLLPDNTDVKSVVSSFNNSKTTYDFTDHTKAINLVYETNWESLNNPTVFKKFLRIKLFSFDTDEDFETPQGFELLATMQTNYKDTDVGQILFNFKQFTGGGWGLFRWGNDAWGNTQSASLKHKLLSNKAKSLKIRFENNVANENILLTSYEMEMAAPYRQEIKE